MNNEFNAAIEAGTAVAKPGKIKSLLGAVKAAPVKTAVVVLGTTAVVAGTVYGVKKYGQYRQNKSDGTIEAEFTEVETEDKADA